MRNPGTHLHETVETAASGPGARPSIGTERNIDESGRERLSLRRRVAQIVECGGTIPVNQNVTLREQGFKLLPVFSTMKIQSGAPLSERYFRTYAGLLPSVRINPQN